MEQKNWSVVRRLVGYDRYTSKAALEQLNAFYRYLRLYVNFFQPVMKLQCKTRHGAKVHKIYDTAQTPYQRVLQSKVLTPQQQETLSLQYQKLNPVQLLSHINQTLEHLWALAEHPQHKEASVTPIFDATRALRYHFLLTQPGRKQRPGDRPQLGTSDDTRQFSVRSTFLERWYALIRHSQSSTDG